MKGVVVYDSRYGNTKKVAEAIADELQAEGVEAEVRNVRERQPGPPQGDIMFLGSPVWCGTISPRVKRVVNKLDKDAWKDKPIVVFTTTLKLPEDATEEQKQSQEKYDRGAGRNLRDLARSKGLNAVEDPFTVEVEGMKGPLVETGVDQARRFTHEALASVKG